MNFRFTYVDDGLPLSGPTALDPGDTLRTGQPAPFVTFEAGVLWVDVNASSHRVFGFAQGSDPAGITMRDGYVLFGANDHPDSFAGTISVTVRPPSTTAPYVFAVINGVEVDARLASVAAIPEPSTYALLGVGLVAIAAAGAWRRRPDASARLQDSQTQLS